MQFIKDKMNRKKKTESDYYESVKYRNALAYGISTGIIVFIYQIYLSPYITNRWTNIFVQFCIILLDIFIVNCVLHWYDRNKK